MAEEQPIIPPLRKPVSAFPTPSHAVSMYTELVNRDDPAYKANAPVKRGSIYSTMVGAKPEVIEQFPLLYFLRERRYAQSDQMVFWDWINDEAAHDTYNSTDTYAFESIGHPGFQREYTVRRDLYNDDPFLVLGLPLSTLTAVTINDGGRNYSYATGTVAGTTVAIDFVILDGAIISGIVTDQGEGILGDVTITITGDGAGAEVSPIVQSTACVLVGQRKVELDEQDPLQHEFVKIIRTYATLQGPTIYSTRIDEDGAVVTIATTLKIAATIVPREYINVNVWYKVSRQQTDNVYVANEVIESRTVKTATSDPADNHTMRSSRIDSDGVVVQIDSTLAEATSITEGELLLGGAIWQVTNSQAVSDLVSHEIIERRVIPGNPVISSRLDDDGFEVAIVRTLRELLTIVTQETLNGTNWVRTTIDSISLRLHSDELSDLVAWEVIEARHIPGVAVLSTRLDEDGVRVNIDKTRKETSTIVIPDEAIIGNQWVRKHIEAITELVAFEVVEIRDIPGNPMVSVKIDRDGNTKDTIRTMKDTLLVNPSEQIGGGGIWVITEKEAITELVCWEVVSSRTVTVSNPVYSYQVDQDQETVTKQEILKQRSAITPGASENTGTLTIVQGEAVSDLIANEVTTTKEWLDETIYSQRLPDSIIPVEFRASIPTVTESHILVGMASMPTLTGTQLFVQERQLTKIFYERRVETLGLNLVFPIDQIGYELTEQYGGATLEVKRRLNNSALFVEEGEDVTSSVVNPIGVNLMWIRETKRRYLDPAWPINPSRLWDDNMREEYDQSEQVVPSGTSEEANPGVFAWVSEVKAIDKWRSQRINTAKSQPIYNSSGSALITYRFKPFKFPGYLVGTGFGYYVRSAYAELIRHTIRTWWEVSPLAPVVVIEDIIPENIIISTLNSTSTLAYSGEVLHDDITTFGTLFWPATTPSYTEYITSWIGFEHIIAATITPEKEKDLWKVQTESVTMY